MSPDRKAWREWLDERVSIWLKAFCVAPPGQGPARASMSFLEHVHFALLRLSVLGISIAFTVIDCLHGLLLWAVAEILA